MLIQKQTTGEVYVFENSQLLAVLAADCTMQSSWLQDGIRVTDVLGQCFEFPLFRVKQLQILPAAATSFSGTVATLFNTLCDGYFNNLNQTTNGGGGEITENETEVTTGTYFILPTDKNIICTGDCTVVLPLTTSGKFAFRIWAAAGVTVSIKGSGSDTVDGQTDVMIGDGEMVTVQNLLTNTNWSIGH